VLGVVLALFIVGPVWAVPLGVSTPRPADDRLVLRTSYDGSMESRPDQRRPVPGVHPLEVPFVWFGIQLIEFAVVVLLMRQFVPEDVPTAVGVTILVVAMAGLAVVNYRIRRRFIPR
jgi:hypothetical protein